ncbi:MAG: phosphoribosyltransferase family protein [Ferruginibacter sp.]
MILSAQTARKKLQRMALEVAERNAGKEALVLIGIKENGIHIAHVLASYLAINFKGSIEVISLELNKKMPAEITLDKTIDFNGKNILLIDDVANSGRTMMYALKPLLDKYPAQVETLALVERTHKQFPIAINYCGISVSTTAIQTIIVEVNGSEISGAYIR